MASLSVVISKGRCAGSRHTLDENDLRRYAARVAELADAELSDWVHRGSILPA
jgi:hypothetical protein